MRRITVILVLVMILFSASPALAVPIEQIYQIIEVHAVEPVNSIELRQKELPEIPQFLNDPYFTYMPPDLFRQYLDSHQGSFGGIGITVTKQGGKLIITAKQPGTPAALSGLLIGDEIIAVDGISVRGLSVQELAVLLRGEPESNVAVTILRNGSEYTFILIRAVIKISSVTTRIQNNIAVMNISSFTSETPAEFRAALKTVRLALPDGLVIDLRGNPGGALAAVLEVAQELVPAGPVVRLRSRREPETVFLIEEDPAPLPFFVVLMDENSASAAEILAGAVQDSGAGVIIGCRSYGKGSAQSVFLLKDGGGLRLTTHRFYTPLGNPVEGVGIKPDIEIKHSDAQLNFALKMIKTNAARQMTFTIGRSDVWKEQKILQTNSVPFINNNRSYLPLRFLARAMGYLVEWDEETFTATLRQGSTAVEIPLRKNIMYINNRKVYLQDPVIIRENRSYIPVRAVAEALGCAVYWNNDARQVTVRW